jgi:hypothetical protein
VAGPRSNQRHAHDLLIQVDRIGGQPVAPKPVVAQQKSIGAGEDGERILPKAALLYFGHQTRHLIIERGEAGSVFAI